MNLVVENGSGAKLNGHLSAFAENLFESDCNHISIEISERIQIALSFCVQITGICKVKMNCIGICKVKMNCIGHLPSEKLSTSFELRFSLWHWCFRIF